MYGKLSTERVFRWLPIVIKTCERMAVVYNTIADFLCVCGALQLTCAPSLDHPPSCSAADTES